MNQLRVEVSEDVRLQISDQVFYIARDSITEALEWEVRLRAAINSLGNFYGHAVDEDASKRLGETVQKLVFEATYLVHYRVNREAGVVEIVNLRHGARLPKGNEP